jgi:predicted porin
LTAWATGANDAESFFYRNLCSTNKNDQIFLYRGDETDMKKHPLPLTLCVALGAASFCTVASAQLNLQLYGRLYPYLNSEKASGATPIGTAVSTLAATAAGPSAISGGIKGMVAGNSNLGIRGSEKFGSIKAEFQVEGVVGLDEGMGFLWNRNDFVGLSGNFGSVKLGFMDTVFKEYGDTIGVLNVSSGTPMSSSNILRKVSFGASNNARFHERRANSIRYDSPSLSGFEFGLQVSTQEAPLAGVTASGNSAKTYSYGVKYDNGPIYVALAMEQHTNWYGGSSNAPTARRNLTTAGVTSNDKAMQLTIEVRPTKEHKIEFDVIKKKYDENATITGRFQNYQNTAYLVGWEARWTPQWRTVVQIVKSGAGSCTLVATACSTDGLEGSKFITGASYYISRRTYVFGVYDKMTNGASGRFAANDFGAVNSGEDSRHFIAGISHAF